MTTNCQPPGGHTQSPLLDLENNPTLTVDQAAKILHISRASAYKAVRSGQIPSIRLGRRVLIPTARLSALLGLNSDAAPPQAAGDGA